MFYHINMNQRITNNIGVIIPIAVSGLLFLNVFFDVSGTLPDGWFHFLLGVFLLVSGIILFISRNTEKRRMEKDKPPLS